MQLNVYQKNANKTAKYPKAILDLLLEDKPDWVSTEDTGGPHVFGVMRIHYVTLGLMEEICELFLEIDGGPTVEGVKKELGDIMWYLSQFATELNVPLQTCFKYGKSLPADLIANRLLTFLILQLRSIPGDMKRLVRDNKGVLPEKTKLGLMATVGTMIRTVAQLSDKYMVGFETVLSTNVEKLADRQQRDVISGEGDER